MPCETMRIIQRQRLEEEAKKKKKEKETQRKAKQKFSRFDTKRIVTREASRYGWQVKGGGWKFTLTKPFSNDRMEVEILQGDKVKIDVPGVISGPNHSNAENFLANLPKALGGKVISLVHKMGHAAMHAMGVHHHH